MKDPKGQTSFDEGDIVFFDPEKDACNNCFVAVKEQVTKEQDFTEPAESSTTFKQLILEGNNAYLKALNPDWPDRITPIKDRNLICGVAIGKFQPFFIESLKHSAKR